MCRFARQCIFLNVSPRGECVSSYERRARGIQLEIEDLPVETLEPEVHIAADVLAAYEKSV